MIKIFATISSMIVFLNQPATDEDIKKASEEYVDFIKITIDVESEVVAIGGEYHFDAEQLLLQKGSKQDTIWGGGLSLKTGLFATNAMINLRVPINSNPEILDSDIREKFLRIAKKYLKNFI